MTITRRAAAVLTLAAMVVALLASSVPAKAASTGSYAFRNSPTATSTVAANTGVTAAVGASKLRYPSSGAAPNVFVARDDAFADALTASSLTRWGPLLFVKQDSLPQPTSDEIRRALRNGGNVYIMGGERAITPAVEEAIRNHPNVAKTFRLAGATRIETATAIADQLVRFRATDPEFRTATPRGVLIARSDPRQSDASQTSGWADAIAAGASAAYRAQPILLTNGDSAQLSAPTDRWIRDHNEIAESTILGGPAAVHAGVNPPTGQRFRVAGPERAATAALLGPAFHGQHAPDPYRKFLVINGYHRTGWTYGLAAAGLAADTGAPLLLVSDTGVPDATADLLRGCDGHHVETMFVGGDTLIPANVRQQVEALDNSCPAGPYGYNRGLDHACHAFSRDEIRDLQPEGRDTFLSRQLNDDYVRKEAASSCYFALDRESGNGIAGAMAPWVNVYDDAAPGEVRDHCDRTADAGGVTHTDVNGTYGCVIDGGGNSFLDYSLVIWQWGSVAPELSFDMSRDERAALTYARSADTRLR